MLPAVAVAMAAMPATATAEACDRFISCENETGFVVEIIGKCCLEVDVASAQVTNMNV